MVCILARILWMLIKKGYENIVDLIRSIKTSKKYGFFYSNTSF